MQNILSRKSPKVQVQRLFLGGKARLKPLWTKKFKGLGTLEIVIIIAVLLALALLFKEQIQEFAQTLMDKVFDSSILDQI